MLVVCCYCSCWCLLVCWLFVIIIYYCCCCLLVCWLFVNRPLVIIVCLLYNKNNKYDHSCFNCYCKQARKEEQPNDKHRLKPLRCHRRQHRRARPLALRFVTTAARLCCFWLLLRIVVIVVVVVCCYCYCCCLSSLCCFFVIVAFLVVCWFDSFSLVVIWLLWLFVIVDMVVSVVIVWCYCWLLWLVVIVAPKTAPKQHTHTQET